jgi:hypothetical protein
VLIISLTLSVGQLVARGYVESQGMVPVHCWLHYGATNTVMQCPFTLADLGNLKDLEAGRKIIAMADGKNFGAGLTKTPRYGTLRWFDSQLTTTSVIW